MIKVEFPVDCRMSTDPFGQDEEREFESQVRDKLAPTSRTGRKRERMREIQTRLSRDKSNKSEPEDRRASKMHNCCELVSSGQAPGDDALHPEACGHLATSLASSTSSSFNVINRSRISCQKQARTQATSTRLAATLFLLALGLVFTGRVPNRSSTNFNTQNCNRVQLGAEVCDSKQMEVRMGGAAVLLASAEGVPEIGSLRTYWRRHQQLTQKNPAPSAQQQTLSLDEPTMKPNKIPIPVYTLRPEVQLRLREGTSHALRCATKERLKSNYWTKDGEMLFDLNMSKFDELKARRFTFIGNMDQNDYSIELRDARVDDSGVYRCHTYNTVSNVDNEYDFLVMSNVTVEPAPPVTQSPSALESDLDDRLESSTQQQQRIQHSQRSTVITHATMPQTFQSDSALQTSSLVQPPASHTLTRLPPPTRLFSNRNTSTTSLRMDARLTMPFVWPYILLALAAILMLTNVYLIYSLVRRHTRRRRSDVESPSPRERKLSSSSSSGVGSGQGSTSVHKLTK